MLQREVSDRMAGRLDVIKTQPNHDPRCRIPEPITVPAHCGSVTRGRRVIEPIWYGQCCSRHAAAPAGGINRYRSCARARPEQLCADLERLPLASQKR